jgi:hypothetical protein
LLISPSSPCQQGKIKELELQVEQLQRAKEARRPKTGTTLLFETPHTFLTASTAQPLPLLLQQLLLAIHLC